MAGFLELHSQTGKALRAVIDRAVRRHGLRFGQDLLLSVLWEHDGATPGEVAAFLHVTTPTVVTMATRIAEAGLLTRRPDEHDRRLVRLWLTDAGWALRGPIESERRSIEQQVMEGLTAHQRTQLIRSLAKVQQAASDLLAGAVE